MTTRRSFVAGSLAAVATAAPALVRAQSRVKLRIGATANDSFAEAYYAQDLGYFARGQIAGGKIDQSHDNGAEEWVALEAVVVLSASSVEGSAKEDTAVVDVREVRREGVGRRGE